MATSNLNPIAANNIGLRGGRFQVYGAQAVVDGSTKAINTSGTICFETDETVASSIEALIAEDLQRHPVDAIDHILIGPNVACLLFLDGRIGHKQINSAVESGNEIKINDVKFKAGGEERGFTVVIRNGHDGFATMNKVGEVL